jgi:hypothetical protein
MAFGVVSEREELVIGLVIGFDKRGNSMTKNESGKKVNLQKLRH